MDYDDHCTVVSVIWDLPKCDFWGDVYPHETLIANIRRLLDEDFCCRSLCETPQHFRERMRKVENHCNSKDFAAADGRGLHALTKSFRDRCQQVIDREGERIPK